MSLTNTTELRAPKKCISKTLLYKWVDAKSVRDLRELTLDELRELCNHFKLNAKGGKQKLACRLIEHWDNFEESDSE